MAAEKMSKNNNLLIYSKKAKSLQPLLNLLTSTDSSTKVMALCAKPEFPSPPKGQVPAATMCCDLEGVQPSPSPEGKKEGCTLPQPAEVRVPAAVRLAYLHKH